jgi:ketosteroid isomerase-like protein
MSEENVEVVLAAVDAVNRRDPDPFIACLHSDIEWRESGDPFPGLRGTYRGRCEQATRDDPRRPGKAHGQARLRLVKPWATDFESR